MLCPGFEPKTSCTLREYYTPRPMILSNIFMHYFTNIFTNMSITQIQKLCFKGEISLSYEMKILKNALQIPMQNLEFLR